MDAVKAKEEEAFQDSLEIAMKLQKLDDKYRWKASGYIDCLTNFKWMKDNGVPV